MDDVTRNDQLTGGPRRWRSGRAAYRPRPVERRVGRQFRRLSPQYVTGSAPGDAFSVAVKLHHLAAERNMDRHLDGVRESLGLSPR